MIPLTTILFYLFATIAVFSALMVVTVKNTVKGVLFLVLTFFASAGIWLLLDTEFLALILVLVYVGAVMTLFLFVVMMLNLQQETFREKMARYWPIGALTVVGIMTLVILATYHGDYPELITIQLPANYSNVSDLGSVLYTDYVWPFEVAAVLLLTAIVAAIALAHRPAKSTRQQNVSKQIAVKPKDRVRIVEMKSEKR
ncbi:MAG: NADH-quinone oxidoreductase subunit J [Gammaproteobacteria bacterium]|nr:NADH-quinone oxidoreductase subunit J [Gammaproteobacteria bacterium]